MSAHCGVIRCQDAAAAAAAARAGFVDDSRPTCACTKRVHMDFAMRQQLTHKMSCALWVDETQHSSTFFEVHSSMAAATWCIRSDNYVCFGLRKFDIQGAQRLGAGVKF